jgi:hypothetical protein
VRKIVIRGNDGFSITKGTTALAAAVNDYIGAGPPPSITVSSPKTGIAASPAEQFQSLLASTPLKENTHEWPAAIDGTRPSAKTDEVWEIIRRDDGYPITKRSPFS